MATKLNPGQVLTADQVNALFKENLYKKEYAPTDVSKDVQWIDNTASMGDGGPGIGEQLARNNSWQSLGTLTPNENSPGTYKDAKGNIIQGNTWQAVTKVDGGYQYLDIVAQPDGTYVVRPQNYATAEELNEGIRKMYSVGGFDKFMGFAAPLVATLVTGGAASALGGGLAGASIGAVGGAISSGMAGGDIGKGALTGAIGGGLAGSKTLTDAGKWVSNAAGIESAAGVKAVTTGLRTAATSAANSAVNGGDFGDIIRAGGTGFVAGGAGSYAGSMVDQALNSDKVTEAGLSASDQHPLTNTLSRGTGGLVSGYIQGGSDGAWRGAASGAASGAATDMGADPTTAAGVGGLVNTAVGIQQQNNAPPTPTTTAPTTTPTKPFGGVDWNSIGGFGSILPFIDLRENRNVDYRSRDFGG